MEPWCWCHSWLLWLLCALARDGGSTRLLPSCSLLQVSIHKNTDVYTYLLYIPIFTSRNNWKISILGHEMLNFSKLDLLLVRHFFKILLWVPEKWKRALTCNSFRDGSQICRVCATCYNYECSQSTNEKWVLMKSLEYDIFMDVCVVALCLVAQLYKPVHLDIQPKLKLNKYSFARGRTLKWLINYNDDLRGGSFTFIWVQLILLHV